MVENTDILRDEERISGNLEITMQEIKSLKNEVNELKKSMEFTQNDLEERVNNVEENMCKVKEDLKEIYEYQINPDYVNDSLTDIRNKLIELEEMSRRNSIGIDEYHSMYHSSDFYKRSIV